MSLTPVVWYPGGCEWAVPIQKLQPRNGQMTEGGKARGKAAW